MKILLNVLQSIYIISFLFFLFYLLKILGTSHTIPFQTYFKIGITGFLSIISYLLLHFFKKKNK